ncbi:MAG TPA: ABC transporter substrate-binding protein, partial [Thermaerobacter sp.]
MAPGRWRVTLAVALIGAVVLGWWAVRAPEATERRPPGRPGGTWVEPIPVPPASLDPARARSEAEVRVAALLYDGLVRLGPDGRLYPALARRWEVRDGGTRYVFWLRPGVRFHNGRPLTAADVVFSLARLADPRRPAPRDWVLEGVVGADAYRLGRAPVITGLRALGPDRVEIRLVGPRPAFLYRLATPGAAIVDAETVATGGGGVFPAVGTGPFRLVERTEAAIRLEAYAGHYRGRPYLDAVELVVGGSRRQALAAFAAGQLTAVRLLPHEVRDLAAHGWAGPQWRLELPATVWIELNAGRPPLTHPAVRRALAYAVDRETLVAGLAPAGYRLAEGWIPPGMAGFRRGSALPAYRVREARALLHAAGVQPGVELRWLQPGDLFWSAVAGRLDYLLGRVGLELDVTTVAQTDFPPLDARDAPYHLAPRATWAEYPDPEALFLPWAGAVQARAAGAAGERDPAAGGRDHAVHQALAAFLPARGRQRAEAAARLEARLLESGFGLPLYHPVVVWAVQPHVR